MKVDEKRAAELLAQWGEWLRWEAASRSVPINFLTGREFLDAPQPPDFVRAEAERTYRRGYFHGFIAALEALNEQKCRQSKVMTRLNEYVDGPLYRWRYSDASSEVRPPRIER